MAMTLSKTKTFGGFAFEKLSFAVPKIRDLKKFREITFIAIFFQYPKGRCSSKCQGLSYTLPI